MIGCLLGDLHLENQSVTKKTYRAKIEQSFEKKEYVLYLYELFRIYIPDALSEKPRMREIVNTTGKLSRNFRFQTRTHFYISCLGKLFYREKKKIIPSELSQWMTSKSLAFWYLDDGSIKSKDSKGCFLNTQG